MSKILTPLLLIPGLAMIFAVAPSIAEEKPAGNLLDDVRMKSTAGRAMVKAKCC
jgi:hypothetical protein